MSKNKKSKVRFFASVPMMVGTFIMFVFSYGIFLFVTIYDVAREQLFETPLLYAFVCIPTLIFPTLAFIITARRWFTLITIDEKGITTALFHFFYRKKITWEELKEIRFYFRVAPFLFFSKDISLENMYYDDIIKHKDVIQVSLTKKVYKAITAYSDKPIDNLSEEAIQYFKLEK